ncbi:MAG: hypothetical protein ACR2KK_03375 [Acidimicrobiales bacterium]
MDREGWNQRHEAPDLVRAHAERVHRTVRTEHGPPAAIDVLVRAPRPGKR